MILHLKYATPHGYYFSNGGVNENARYYQQGNPGLERSHPTFYASREVAINTAASEGHTIHVEPDTTHSQIGQ